ncbi:MAG: sugar ABC transporter substrate-binding protein [Candidatus Binatia bacterium]
MRGQGTVWSRFRRLAALAVLLSLSSCRSDSAGDDAVVFWAMGSEAEAADAVLAGFRQQYPEIAVRVQRVPWSAAHEKLLTAYVGGSMPDVFQLGNTWVAELEMLGALEPLDAQVASSGVVAREDFFAGVLDANVVDGRLVALPWYVDTRLLFYRRDLLSAAGVTAPPRTWEEWRVAMQRIRSAPVASGGAANPYGVFLPVDEWQTPVVLAMQHGTSMLADNDTRGNFRSPEMRRAVEFYAGLFRDDLAPRKSEAQIANLYREFAAGYFAFFVTGPWNLVELARRMPAELADAWTTAPMPSIDGAAPGLSIAGGASLAVSASSPRKEQAWKLVEYLSSTKVQVEFRVRSGDLPSRRSAWDHGAVDEKSRAFRAQLDHLVATPKIPEWERIASKLTLHLERIVRGDAGIDEALADLDADVDAILAKRRSMLAESSRRESRLQNDESGPPRTSRLSETENPYLSRVFVR